MTPELADSEQPGVTFQGRYTLERELGRGGMATVYLAEDLTLHRRVAIKLLHPEHGAALGPERFQREIAIASRLSHPHILPLYDAGSAGERLFYTMPFINGESLRERLQREPQLPIDEAVTIASAVAAALDYAHGQGIIHRDIKPENILLARATDGRQPQVLVADFGIARAVDAAAGEKLTETGLALGTPSYMSPEQAAAGRLDARSDIYALGCVTYEMLVGNPPFAGPTAQAILARHAVDSVPPLRTVRATTPLAVEQAVLKALAKVPADRFATGGEFAEALVAEPGRTLRRRLLGHRGAMLLLGIGITAAAVGLAARSLHRPEPSVTPSAARIAVLPFFSPTGDTALIRLGGDLAVTLSASLNGVGELETADRLTVATQTADGRTLSPAEAAALARRLGASSVLRGTLVRVGDNVRLDLGLYSAAGLAPVAEGITVTAHRDSIGVLTDSAAWGLLRQVWRRGDPPSPSLAAVTTRSLPALRAFLEGERELEKDRWETAALAYRSAIAADSTFWLAQFRYALAQRWRYQSVEPEVLEALRLHRTVFPERERLLVDGFLADSLAVGIERYRLVTQKFPDYWPGWFLYGDILYHGGPQIGYDGSEALAAFRRVVSLNPKLAPGWQHILELTVGRDQAEASRAYARLTALASSGSGGQYANLLAWVDRAGGVIPPELDGVADSMAKLLASPAGRQILNETGNFGVGLLRFGFPAAGIEVNRRTLRMPGIRPEVSQALRFGIGWAWAARGRWDTAVTTVQEVANEHPGVLGPPKYRDPSVSGIVVAIENYAIAVLGAWLGATPPAVADQRRPGALAAIVLLSDEESRREARGRVAWLDGLLGLARGDRRAIRAARRDADRSGYSQAKRVDRSLAAFERGLMGDWRRAGRELAALEDMCMKDLRCNHFTPQTAVQRLAAAQWLLRGGEVEEARRLLRRQDAASGWIGLQWVATYAVDAPASLARARVEESRREPGLARDYYQRFLRLYDQPMPSQIHLIEEARAALARLEASRLR